MNSPRRLVQADCGPLASSPGRLLLGVEREWLPHAKSGRALCRSPVALSASGHNRKLFTLQECNRSLPRSTQSRTGFFRTWLRSPRPLSGSGCGAASAGHALAQTTHSRLRPSIEGIDHLGEIHCIRFHDRLPDVCAGPGQELGFKEENCRLTSMQKWSSPMLRNPIA